MLSAIARRMTALKALLKPTIAAPSFLSLRQEGVSLSLRRRSGEGSSRGGGT